MSNVNCILIEDNFSDRKSTENYITKIPFLNLIGSYTDACEAEPALEENNVHLILLDIDIPKINGIDYLRTARPNICCIIITAHPEYAIDGFEARALDYIVKPLKFERFEKAIERAKEYLEIINKAVKYDLEFGNNLLTIKEGATTFQIKINEIVYLEALGDYTKIITIEKKYLTLHNLKNFIEKLPENKFLRIHRSFAVARDKILKLDQNELILEKIRLPIGKTYRRDLNRNLIA